MKKARKKFVAVYMRVSSSPQSTRSQRPDLEQYIKGNVDEDTKVLWFVDKMTGKTMDRPAWNRVYKKIQDKRVAKLIVWRLDRLGRKVTGVAQLIEDLNKYKVKFVSIREGMDLSTPAGRMLANVLTSLAEYEREVSGERIRAGQIVARASGKKWGGSKKGRLTTITKERAKAVLRMKDKGDRVCTIAKTLNMNRPSIERILQRHQEGILKLA